jgi:type I restriction enzyme R subunit/putative DNA methylase
MSFHRRHLPHWIPEQAIIFVTWRLASSPFPCPNGSEPLDSGPVWLSDTRIARVVADALSYGDAPLGQYRLHAWVIMPNRVHAVLEPHVPFSAMMRWLKGRTSRISNRLLGRTGQPFWQNESFDRWIRSRDELRYLINYVEENPVRAGLVGSKEQWRWSSAAAR